MKKNTNPLLALSNEKKERVFFLLRNCDAVDDWIERETGVRNVSKRQIAAFFKAQANAHWGQRIERAAQEANTMIELVRKNRTEFSEGVLAALGQEAFRQIASGKVEPGVLAQFVHLFNRVRSDYRAEKTLKAKLQKQKEDLRSKTERALDAMAKEIRQNKTALEAFAALRSEMLENVEQMEAA